MCFHTGACGRVTCGGQPGSDAVPVLAALAGRRTRPCTPAAQPSAEGSGGVLSLLALPQGRSCPLNTLRVYF